MIGKELVRLIVQNKLTEYEITVKHWPDGWEKKGVLSLDITGIGDIGHHHKVMTLETKECGEK